MERVHRPSASGVGALLGPTPSTSLSDRCVSSSTFGRAYPKGDGMPCLRGKMKIIDRLPARGQALSGPQAIRTATARRAGTLDGLAARRPPRMRWLWVGVLTAQGGSGPRRPNLQVHAAPGRSALRPALRRGPARTPGSTIRTRSGRRSQASSGCPSPPPSGA